MAVRFPPERADDGAQLRFGEGRFEELRGLVKGEGDRRAHEHPWCRRCAGGHMVNNGSMPSGIGGGLGMARARARSPGSFTRQWARRQ